MSKDDEFRNCLLLTRPGGFKKVKTRLKKIIEVDLSVDQVLKYVISMGVSTTDKEFIKNNKKKRK